MQLAKKAGYTSTASISEIESGKKAPTIDKLQCIANVLQVPLSLLVTPVDYDSTEKKAILLADMIMLFRNTGDIPALDSISAIVKSELSKIKL